jgi:hypothetical protein
LRFVSGGFEADGVNEGVDVAGDTLIEAVELQSGFDWGVWRRL